MSRSKKHILNAAKRKISDDLTSDFLKSTEVLDRLVSDYSESADDALLPAIDEARGKAEQSHQNLEDWNQKPRVKKKKAVEWSDDYDPSNRPACTNRRVVKTEAYRDFKKTSPTSRQPETKWLEEGTLVCKRGQKKAMIVVEIQDGSSQVLNDGVIEWHRNLSLRPFESEDL